MTYNIYVTCGSGHGRYSGDVKAPNIKAAYKKAVDMYIKQGEYLNKIAKFYVAYAPICNNNKGKYHTYGYSSFKEIEFSFQTILKANPFKIVK